MPYKRVLSVALLSGLVLAGCSTSSEPSRPDAPVESGGEMGGRCNADAAQFAVGQQASAALLEEVRAKSGAQVARILKPHDMVTLEYRSDRVNLNADDTGKIVRANCG